MSLPKYPEYKDSGVEWLGRIPGHWGIRKFRHSFRESHEKIEGALSTGHCNAWLSFSAGVMKSNVCRGR